MQAKHPPTDSAFLLIFRDANQDTYRMLSPQQRQELLQRWNEWYDALAAAGKVQHGHPLEPDGRIVRSDGGRVIDGPFVEAKETVGGYFLLTVGSLEEATEIAKQCPSLQLDLGLSVEVRQVAGTCPVLKSNGVPHESKSMAGVRSH